MWQMICQFVSGHCATAYCHLCLAICSKFSSAHLIIHYHNQCTCLILLGLVTNYCQNTYEMNAKKVC
jgi:hypothetical protein